MEFPFSVTELFRAKITKVKGDLMPEGFAEMGIIGRQTLNYVSQVVDALGLESAEAQGLTRPVTSADRLRNSDNTLYVMTDNNGSKNGRVVGFLKTGYKNLFLYDKRGNNHETKSLCVLDFFICKDLQRRGYGKELFEHMLRDSDASPQHLALDRPSDLFLAFMQKHYDLSKTIPQLNHYVIYESFFSESNARSPKSLQQNNPQHDVSAQHQMQGEQISLAQQEKHLHKIRSQQQDDRSAMTQQQMLQMASAMHMRLWGDNKNTGVSECLSYPTFGSPWHGGNAPPSLTEHDPQMASGMSTCPLGDKQNSGVGGCLSYPTFSSPWHGGNAAPTGIPQGNFLAAGLVVARGDTLGSDNMVHKPEGEKEMVHEPEGEKEMVHEPEGEKKMVHVPEGEEKMDNPPPPSS